MPLSQSILARQKDETKNSEEELPNLGSKSVACVVAVFVKEAIAVGL